MDWNATFLPSVHASLRFEPDADHALEHCEDLVIAARRSELREEESTGDTVLERFAEDMESQLERRILFEDIAHELRDRLEVRDYAAGEALVVMGAPTGGLQLLLTGRASVYDAAGVRLRQCGSGDAIEPHGAFGARAATVAALADEPCRTLTMTPAVRGWLEGESRATDAAALRISSHRRGRCRSPVGTAPCRGPPPRVIPHSRPERHLAGLHPPRERVRERQLVMLG